MTVKKMIISLLKGTERFENHDEYFRKKSIYVHYPECSIYNRFKDFDSYL